MKKFFISFGIGIACIVLVLFVYEKKSTAEQNASHYMLSKEEIAQLQNGDIILRKGYGLVSESIAKMLNEEHHLSHLGIIYIDSLGKISVINSLSASYADYDGVQPSSLQRFCRESQPNSIIVVRYKPTGDKTCAAIAQRAKYYADLKVPFDDSFDLSTPQDFYCTELLWHIFLDEYNVDLYPDKKNLSAMGFNLFFDTTRFQIVINHQQAL